MTTMNPCGHLRVSFICEWLGPILRFGFRVKGAEFPRPKNLHLKDNVVDSKNPHDLSVRKLS